MSMTPELRILVTGDRHWVDFKTIAREIERVFHARQDLHAPEQVLIIEGGASGADSHAARVAELAGYRCQEFPAQWDKYGRAAGPIRNQQMIDEGRPDIVLAFHSDLAKSKGTKDMVFRANKAGIVVKIFPESFSLPAVV